MNTTELAKAIAAREDVTKAEASKVLKAMVAIISEELAAGNSVRIADFGTFSAQHKPERQGHNPRTKEAITIPAHTKAKFSESKALRDAVNG